jgi:glycosyltransferase involved in cell wall biosynthesis
MMADVAIAHDQFRVLGGAERVACEIARALDAPIYAMAVDDEVVPNDVDVRQLADGRGEWLMQRHYLVQDAYQMLAWQHVRALYQYDTIIQTKTNPMWFVPKDRQTVIRYLHSTPRGLYDKFHEDGGDRITDTIKTAQRALFQQTVPYADYWVCNSDLVKRRLHKYLTVPDEDSTVVYPGVDVASTGPDVAPTQDYLFAVGRLASNKRIPLLCKVAQQTNRRVVVAGDGAESRHVEQADADGHLEWVGYIPEHEKQRRLSEASATLMLAENEDFGIVPIESMAAGTPVIGVAEGFTRHQIQDGANGLLCEPTVDDIVATIKQFSRTQMRWSEREIADFAQQFSKPRFRQEIREVVADVRSATTVTADLAQPRPESDGTRLEVEADGGVEQ